MSDLMSSQRKTAEALLRLAGELRGKTERSTTPAIDRAPRLSDTATVARTTLARIQQTPPQADASRDRQALEATTVALRDLISGVTDNTSALQANASAARQGLSSLAGELLRSSSSRGGISGLLGSGLGLAPLGSAILGLFRRRESKTAEFPVYESPSPLNLSVANGEGAIVSLPRTVAGDRGNVRPVSPSATRTPNVVINVEAMDSKSFMDRSGEIASAVREAMLHMHPVNDVIDEL